VNQIQNLSLLGKKENGDKWIGSKMRRLEHG